MPLHPRSSHASVLRSALLPDPVRIARCLRAPELGPRLVFFSGGSALRNLSRTLKQYTHNSVHLITTFDSGGSSAALRGAFAMPAVGDLRNRIVALADESVRGNPQIYRLFCHRLPLATPPEELRQELRRMVEGEHELVRDIPEPMRTIIRTHLRMFFDRMPEAFDLRGANLGNLMLTGGYLENSRDLDSILFLFSKLLEVRGIVRPIAEADLHLEAVLQSGDRIVGQHRITGKEMAPPSSPVHRLGLVGSLTQGEAAATQVADKVLAEIQQADLLCLPMGSFYTSLIANLLPAGVGRALVQARCPRVYVPNTGADPEQRGMSLSQTLEAILSYVQEDAGGAVEMRDVVSLVLLDRDDSHYNLQMDRETVRRMGVEVASVDLVSERSTPHADPQRLAELILSLA